MKEINLTGGKKSGVLFSFGIALYLVLSYLLLSVANAVSPAGGFISIALPSLAAPIALAAVSVYSAVTDDGLIKGLRINKCSYIFYIAALLLAVGMIFGLGFINTLISELAVKAGLNITQREMVIDTLPKALGYVLFLAVLPAVTEEAFFRGAFLKGLNGVPLIGKVLICGTFFAIYHCSLSQLVYQFIYGALLALISEKSLSVIPAVLAHFINNALIIMLQYFNVEIDLFNPIFIACGIIAVAGSVFLTLFFSKTETEKKEKYGKEVWLTFGFGALGIGICLAVLITNLLIK